MDIRDALISDLYESVVFPSQINHAFQRIDQWIGSQGVHLVGWNPINRKIAVSIPIGERIASAVRPYEEYYQHIDPRSHLGIEGLTGEVVACQDLCDATFVRKDEFYQDFLIPNGIRFVLGGNIHRSKDLTALVAFNHLVGTKAFSQEQRDKLASLMPHLISWMSQLRRTDAVRMALQAGDTALDVLGHGVIAFDAKGKIVHANRLARRYLDCRVLKRGSFIRFDQAIDLARMSRQVTVDSILRTETFTILTPSGPAKIALTMVPVSDNPTGDHDTSSGLTNLIDAAGGSETTENTLGLYPSRPRVLAIIQRNACDSRTLKQHLQSSYVLTPTESDVACCLLDGMTPQEIADAMSVSINTTRTHIRALLEKTHSRNLTSLVTLLQRIPRGEHNPVNAPDLRHLAPPKRRRS